MKISKKTFTACVGSEPENDDLERSNCNKAGQMGHFSCGWCLLHEKPQFICGCFAKKAIMVAVAMAAQ